MQLIRLMSNIIKNFEIEAKAIMTKKSLDGGDQNYCYFQYLMTIHNQLGIHQNELAKFMNVNKGSVSKAMKFLLDNHLVYRLQDELDSRMKKVYLTDQGREICKEFKEVLADLESKLMQGFSQLESSQLMDMLNKAYFNMSEDRLLNAQS